MWTPLTLGPGGPQALKQEALDSFGMFDADGGGTLDREEIKSLATSLGSALSDKELDAAMKVMDPT